MQRCSFVSILLLPLLLSGCVDETVVEVSDGPDTQEASGAEKSAEPSNAAAQEEKEHYAVVGTAENFEELVLKSDKPVLVDFWAVWCQPCMMASPKIEELAKKHDGKAVVVKVNVDDYPEIALKYQVDAYPYFLYFKSGEQVDAMRGLIGNSFDDAIGNVEKKLTALLPEASVE